MMRFGDNRVRWRILGRVQGVGFRWFVLAEARRLGLRGWVRNNREGSVELEAEGPSPSLTALRERVLEGPPASHVEHIVELPVTSDELPNPFQIAR